MGFRAIHQTRAAPDSLAVSSLLSEHLSSAVGKAVANHVELPSSIPSVTDVGKEPDREIFSPVSDASV